VNDAVDRVIVEREEMDRGLAGGVILSIGAHTLLLGSVVFVALLAPKEPLLKVVDGFAVALPPGGAGSPTAQAPAPSQPNPEPVKPETTLPAKPEPQKVIKPPKDEKPKGLPDVDAKKTKKRPEKEQRAAARSAGPIDSTGTSTQTPGVSFGEVGPGVPGGTDPNGDWYLAGVQRKIWMLWSQQIHTGSWQPFTVSFTIMADGSVNDVKVVQGSGVFTLDLAAQRAISSAGPFGPLPKNYGTDRYTIQALFKPTS
jgi:TonB family protein